MKTLYVAVVGWELAGLLGGSPSCSAQEWTATGAPATNWSSVASSADGSKLVAAVNGGFIYTSTNSGSTWVATSAPTNSWRAVASSVDGARLFAASDSGEGLYSSADSGSTWQPTGPGGQFFNSIACSADGTKLAATDYGSRAFSTNSGATWTYLESALPAGAAFVLVSTSADGNTPVFVRIDVTSSSSMFTGSLTTNYFDDVLARFWGGLCTSVAMCADGTRFAAVIYAYRASPPGSTNCGGTILTWSAAGPTVVTNCTSVTNWNSVATSADGMRLVAVASGGAIYTSTDAGVSWGPASVTNASWAAVASSADGAKLVAAAYGGGIYTWQTIPAPVLNVTTSANGLLVISWRVPSMTFTLQETSDLATSHWTPVGVSPTLNYGTLQYQVTLPKPQGTVFYRLASP
jgi:hypothetical protein